MPIASQVQSFRDIHVEGQGNKLIINQIVQIAVAEIKSRHLIKSSPYLGLRRFEESNKDSFFGREILTGDLLNLVSENNLVMVAGASGSGKSSVVRAGLIPQLTARLPQGRFRALTMTPDRDPFRSLRGALQGVGVAQSQIDNLDTCSAATLVTVLTSLRAVDEFWLLFIDQFEEVFTRCEDDHQREAFLSGLIQIAALPQSEIKLVLAMRADFFDRFGPYADLSRLCVPGLCLVPDMEKSELWAAIEQPAARHGVVFEEGLIEQIIAGIKGRAGALPLLQYTLDLLWREDDPADDRTLNLRSYERVGGVEGALRRRADALYEFADRQHKTPRAQMQKEAMRQIFLRLIDLSGQGEGALSVSKRAALADFTQPEDGALIRELIEEKLLVTNAQQLGSGAQPQGATVEVAHEALLSAWPTLKDWIAKARDVLYLRNRLSADAQRWYEARSKEFEHADDELWAGGRLAEALELNARGDFQSILGGLSKLEKEFLDQSGALRDRRIREDKERQEAIDKQRFAEAERDRAEQRELDLVIEASRELLLEKEQPIEALLRLQRAYERGSRSPLLPYLLASATRFLDAMQFVLLGHSDSVLSASFSPDGSRIITGSADCTARVWDAHSGDPLAILEGHSGAVTSASQSADGRHIITGSSDNTARIWDAHSGEPLSILQRHSGSITSVGYSRDNHSIITCSGDHTARIWDSQTRTLLATFRGHSAAVTSASFGPDGHTAVTASEDKTALVWNTGSGELLTPLPAHPGAVTSVNYSPDGLGVVTGCTDGTARVWDPQTGELLTTLPAPQGFITSASYSPNGQHIVTTSDDRTLRIWEAHSGELLTTLPGHSGTIRAAHYSADGLFIVTASDDKTARVWATDAVMAATVFAHKDSVTSVAWCPDGHRLVTASEDENVRVWGEDRLLLTLSGHSKSVTGVACSRDGLYVAAASEDDTARVWDLSTGRLQTTLTGHSGTVTSINFSTDGQQLVTASEDETARIWESKTGTLRTTLTGHAGPLTYASFSPDGRRIVTGSQDHTARVWDADSGELMTTLVGHLGNVTSACFNPDGNRILTSSEDHTAQIWDADSSKPLTILQGHSNGVTNACYSPDGKWIATASQDHTARVWEASSGKLVNILRGHSSELTCLRFSHDGRYIATSGHDNTARVWDLQTKTRSAAELLALIHSRLDQRLDGDVIVSAAIEQRPAQKLQTNQRNLAKTESGDLNRREILTVRNQLFAAAKRWSATQKIDLMKANGELWSGARLAHVLELRERDDFRSALGGLSAEEESFLEASRLRDHNRLQEELERQYDSTGRVPEKEHLRVAMNGLASPVRFSGTCSFVISACILLTTSALLPPIRGFQSLIGSGLWCLFSLMFGLCGRWAYAAAATLESIRDDAEGGHANLPEAMKQLRRYLLACCIPLIIFMILVVVGSGALLMASLR